VRGQFTSPITLKADPEEAVYVEGPLEEVDDGIHEATIVCVLVQGDQDPIWVEGRGTWKEGDAVWKGSVGRKGRRLSRPDDAAAPIEPDDKHARGIAMAIAVKDATEENGKFVPPSIVSLTWCVDVELRAESGGTTQVSA
jgi:hypothetical protein